MLELLVVTLVVISIGLYLRLKELERRMHIFDRWADWIEEEFLNADKELIFHLNFDQEEENDGDEN